MAETRKERRRREHRLRKEALKRQRNQSAGFSRPSKNRGKRYFAWGFAVVGVIIAAVLILKKPPETTETQTRTQAKEFSSITGLSRQGLTPKRVKAGTPEFERIIAQIELEHPQIPTVDALLEMSEEELGKVDLAVMNLAVAKTVIGDNYTTRLGLLDQWTDHLKSETKKHLYQFDRDPGNFDHSEGYFRVLMMNTILKEDFGIRYNPKLMESPDNPSRGFSFFQNPIDVFLTGLLADSADYRMGTCASLPVLFAALGRRLGYPIKLATTRGHLFCRWDGDERFNFEITNRGVAVKSDDYYREWPFSISAEEEVANGYLKSLGPKEELAVFLSTLGNVNMAHERFGNAKNCYRLAGHLAPGWRDLKRVFYPRESPANGLRNEPEKSADPTRGPMKPLRLLFLLIWLLIGFESASAFYDPETGRWLSRDPVGEAGGINLYHYCHNDPVNKADYLGLIEIDKNVPKDNEIRNMIVLLRRGIRASEIHEQQWLAGRGVHAYPTNEKLFGYSMEAIRLRYAGDRGEMAQQIAFLETVLKARSEIPDDGYGTFASGSTIIKHFGHYHDPIIDEVFFRPAGGFAVPLSKRRGYNQLEKISTGIVSSSVALFGPLGFSSAGSLRATPTLTFGTNAAKHSAFTAKAANPWTTATQISAPRITPSAIARSQQGADIYPGVDRWRDIILKKGTIIYGGEPGQSAFYTTRDAIRRTGDSAEEIFNGLQVAPHPVHGYRPAMTAYEVMEDIPAAFGRTLANPQHGPGGLPQIVVPGFKRFLKPIHTAFLSH